MLQLFTISVLIFFLINLVNVGLSTIRSLTTIKSTKLVASITNALSYGFYAAIIKMITGFPISTVVIVTILANLIGVYFSIWLYDKFKKDRVWKITILATEKDAMSCAKLLNLWDIGYYTKDLTWGQYDVEFTIFSENQSMSKIIKQTIQDTNAKYYIVELNKAL